MPVIYRLSSDRGLRLFPAHVYFLLMHGAIVYTGRYAWKPAAAEGNGHKEAQESQNVEIEIFQSSDFPVFIRTRTTAGTRDIRWFFFPDDGYCYRPDGGCRRDHGYSTC